MIAENPYPHIDHARWERVGEGGRRRLRYMHGSLFIRSTRAACYTYLLLLPFRSVIFKFACTIKCITERPSPGISRKVSRILDPDNSASASWMQSNIYSTPIYNSRPALRQIFISLPYAPVSSQHHSYTIHGSQNRSLFHKGSTSGSN